MREYPRSQTNSLPCSPVSHDQNSLCSDVSSPSEPASFDIGQRLCWNGSGTPPKEDLASKYQCEGISGAIEVNDGAEEESNATFIGDASDIEEVRIQTVFAETQDAFITRAWPHENVEHAIVQSGGVVTFENAYPLESGLSLEDTIGSSQKIKHGDCKLWPLGGQVVDVAQDYHCSYLVSREAGFQHGIDAPSSNSRACDMVLSPFSGPRSIVRGAEALDEARRLAASIENQSNLKEHLSNEKGDRNDDADADLPTAAEWREGLDVLHKLRAELIKERGARTADCQEGKSTTIAVGEKQEFERDQTDIVAELRYELSIERERVCAERQKNLLLESALRDKEEAQGASCSSAKFDELWSEMDKRSVASEDSSRLAAELAVACAQEAAATAVATHLRAELIEAERQIDELTSMRTDVKRQSTQEEGGAMCDIERAELRSAVQSAVHAEMEEVATVERLRAACDALKCELNAEAELADASRQLVDVRQNGTDPFVVSLQDVNRHHELQLALAASEHEREMDHVRLESEKQILAARVELLSSELANQGFAHADQRLLDTETGAARLLEENRRLQCQLLSEFATAASAAVEASAAASVAASSVAALQEESRANRRSRLAPRDSEGQLQSIQYDMREHTMSPVAKSRCSQTVPQDGAHRHDFEFDSPKDLLRVPHGGDIAAGGTARRAAARYHSRADSQKDEVNSKDRQKFEDSEDENAHSPLSKPFLGGPLGLARALATRSAPHMSRSPVCRLSGLHY
mmetsp:Transcript_94339/g.148422  ORF Transcript_94339/g.148422 Transcript_94339/m.148422 type:complete len:753 (-) Transcript_94339:159-2417(-)